MGLSIQYIRLRVKIKSHGEIRAATIILASQVWDVVVVGAGVAGSALAFSQGRVRG